MKEKKKIHICLKTTKNKQQQKKLYSGKLSNNERILRTLLLSKNSGDQMLLTVKKINNSSSYMVSKKCYSTVQLLPFTSGDRYFTIFVFSVSCNYFYHAHILLFNEKNYTLVG